MELLLILLVISGPLIVLFVKAVRWTNPGPDQLPGRRRALAAGLLGVAIVTGLAVAGGVAEGLLADRNRGNEWGSGFIALFIIFGFPVLAAVFAVFWTAPLSQLANGWRAAAAIVLGLFSALPVSVALFVLMVELSAAFDR